MIPMLMNYLPKRMTIPLLPEVAAALLKLAKEHNENPRQIAAKIVKDELEQRGLLQDSPQSYSPEVIAQ